MSKNLSPEAKIALQRAKGQMSKGDAQTTVRAKSAPIPALVAPTVPVPVAEANPLVTVAESNEQASILSVTDQGVATPVEPVVAVSEAVEPPAMSSEEKASSLPPSDVPKAAAPLVEISKAVASARVKRDVALHVKAPFGAFGNPEFRVGSIIVDQALIKRIISTDIPSEYYEIRPLRGLRKRQESCPHCLRSYEVVVNAGEG